MSGTPASSELAPRVAILGGTGFVGTTLRRTLSASGMDVGVFSRTNGCDLRDVPGAWARLDAFRPNYVVNCAALVGSVNFVMDFAGDVLDVNTRMVLNLYRIVRQMRDVVVINPIANCAYPGVMDEYQEGSLFDGPIHPSVLSYGTTRRMMVVASRCYRDQYAVRSINLIVPNMYGPFDSVNPNKTHALNALIIKFVAARKFGFGTIDVWGSGKPIREWLYVKDLAAVVQTVIESGGDALEPVNIAQNKGYTVRELVDILQKLTHFEGTIAYDAKFPDGAPKKVMNDVLFRQRFPDFQFTPLEAGIAETIAYYGRILQRSDALHREA